MELYYTPEARNDLINIKESIIEKFDDENLAIEVLKKITKTARQLVVFPYLGQELSGITGIYKEQLTAMVCRGLFQNVGTNRWRL